MYSLSSCNIAYRCCPATNTNLLYVICIIISFNSDTQYMETLSHVHGAIPYPWTILWWNRVRPCSDSRRIKVLYNCRVIIIIIIISFIFLYQGKLLVVKNYKKYTNCLACALYFGWSSPTKPSCSKTELNCTATEIRWNKNEDARTSPVSTKRQLLNSLKNEEHPCLLGSETPPQSGQIHPVMRVQHTLRPYELSPTRLQRLPCAMRPLTGVFSRRVQEKKTNK